MALITLRVLDGTDRGKVHADLSTPLTIGREEGNSIQLNDDRISRFHIKIQEDHDKLILTDLESTNGTKVNGDDVRLRILRYGDVVTVGRSVLLFGTEEEIAGRLAALRKGDPGEEQTASSSDSGDGHRASLEYELAFSEGGQGGTTMHTLAPPELPDRMSPGQAAQLSEMLEYFHLRVRELLDSVGMDESGERVTLEQRQWQNLLDLQSRLALLLREIAEPPQPED